MSATDLEQRLRAATNATADEIKPGTLVPLLLTGHSAREPAAGPPRRLLLWSRLAAPAAAAAALIGVVAAVLAVTGGPGDLSFGGGTIPGASTSASPTSAVTASVRDQVSITCGDSLAPTSAMSGNPVTDCAAAWPSLFGATAPALTPYVAGTRISVLPAAQRPLAGYRELPPGVILNTRLIDLNLWLTDINGGLDSRCYTTAAAVSAANAELARLGLARWTVVRPASAANDSSQCVNGGDVNAGRRELQLTTGPDATPPSARSLLGLTRGCLSLGAAVSRIQSQSKVPVSHATTFVEVWPIAVPRIRCTTVHIQDKGMILDGRDWITSILVILIGPATPATSPSS